MIKISICDGSCLCNPGPGGWCYSTIGIDSVEFVYGFEAQTTNNRMELKAVIELLQIRKINTAAEIVYTDSKYVVDGISKWIYGWKKNGWKNAKKEPVKNEDLWKILDEQRRGVEFRWMKGHDIPIEEIELSDSDIFDRDLKSMDLNQKIHNSKAVNADYKKNLLIRVQNQVDLLARSAAEKKISGSISIDLKQFQV